MSESCEFGKLFLYSTPTAYYIVGKNKSKTAAAHSWSILTLYRQAARLGGPVLDTHETLNLSERDVRDTLRQLHAGNARGLQLVCKAYGIIGCVRFLESFYLLLVTKREHQGNICGHKVYSVADTALISLVQPASQTQESSAEKRYRKLLLGLDMTHDFYFSYTYAIANSLQRNMTTPSSGGSSDRFESMFVWNSYLTRSLREALGTGRWVVPLIHGFWQQRTLAAVGQQLTVTLVARRSRFFAGTRFQKRGVNHEGRVANDVEIEQIVWAGLDQRTGTPRLSSLVQSRGSFPLYWNQQGGKLGKPDILLQSFDPLFSASRAHFDDMRERYGSPVICLDLVKAAEKTPREIVLRAEFNTAIAYSNTLVATEDRALHVPWDLNFHAKSNRGAALLQAMGPLCSSALDASHFFVHRPDDKDGTQLQTGVVRTNCVDCLDRTNVAQFAIGLAALGRQLHALALLDGPEIDSRCSLARNLMDLYEAAGHHLARQYGGSEAHSTFFQRQRGDWEAATQSRDLMTSIRRFYSNAYTDADKQMAINLFLGNFIPETGRPALWDLDNDNYLHFTAGGGMRRTSSEALPRRSSLAAGQQLAALLDRPATAAAAGILPLKSCSLDDMASPINADIEWCKHGGTGTDQSHLFGSAATSNLPRRTSTDTRNSGVATTRLQRMLREEAIAAAALRQLARSPVVLPLGPTTRPPHVALLPRVTTRRGLPQRSAAAVVARKAVSLDSGVVFSRTSSLTQPASPSAILGLGQDQGSAVLPDPRTAVVAAPQGSRSGSMLQADAAPETEAFDSEAEERCTLPSMPLSATSSPSRRRHRLESLDKLIGQPPDVVHQVRLDASPSQRAHRSSWLGAPVGRCKTSERTAVPTKILVSEEGQLPSIAENGSGSWSPSLARRSTDSSPLRPLTEISGFRRAQSTDSGLQLLSVLRYPAAGPQLSEGGPPMRPERRRQSLSAVGNGSSGQAVPEDPDFPLDASRESCVDSLLVAERIGLLSASRKENDNPTGIAPGIGPETRPEFALTGPLPIRMRRSMSATPTVQQLLSTDVNGLGVSPYLLTSWLSADDHLSKSAAAGAALMAHYRQFITEAQSPSLLPRTRSCSDNEHQIPALGLIDPW